MYGIGQTIRHWLAILVVSAVAFAVFASNQLKAQQASASSNPQDTAASTSGENTGQDFTSPENLFQLRYQYKTAPGTGSVKGTIRTVTTDTLYLRSDFTFDLSSPWKVVFRSDLPFVAKDPISSDHPSGDYLYGMGDVDFQAALIEQINERWAAGGGLRTIAPTGPDNITSGKWLRQAKQAIARGLNMSLSDGLVFETEAYYRTIPTEDRREGITSFNEKRSPIFRGK